MSGQMTGHVPHPGGQGGAAFHPAMMLKAVLYASCVGVSSGRKIARAVTDDVVFRWPGPTTVPTSGPSPQEKALMATDPESRIMKTRKGFIQWYNAQAW
jgi:hypothetical protein